MDNDIFYKQLCSEEERLLVWLSKIRELKTLYIDNRKVNSPNVDKVVNHKVRRVRGKKKKGMTIPEKVKAALEQIKAGRVSDVAKALVDKIDTSYTFEKAKKDAAYHLSKLFTKGEINATGEKRTGYVYSIKE